VLTYGSCLLDFVYRTAHLSVVSGCFLQLLHSKGNGMFISNVSITKQWRTQEFFGGFKNSVEYRGQRERGSGGGSPLVRGSTQFAND
jgi:hypothetical protein